MNKKYQPHGSRGGQTEFDKARKDPHNAQGAFGKEPAGHIPTGHEAQSGHKKIATKKLTD